MLSLLRRSRGLRATAAAAPRRFLSSTPAVQRAVADDLGLPDIIITPRAAKKVVEFAAKQNKPELMLRVAVEGGGCSGFQYVYEFETNAPNDEEDIVFDQHGGRVVVDKESLEFIRGSTIDYEQELIRSAFAVTNNPNAASGCGCGTSFDLKE